MERELFLLFLTVITFIGLVCVAFAVVLAGLFASYGIHSAIDDYRLRKAQSRRAREIAKGDADFWAEVRAQLSDKEIELAQHLRPGEFVASQPRKIK